MADTGEVERLMRQQEQIDWEEEDYQAIAGKKPGAKYGMLSTIARQTVKESTVCSMFCGGQKCKYCNPEYFSKDFEQVVKGLYSSWVTDNILATSRPTTKAMEDFNILDQFKEQGINSIINLQQPGEHLSCGFGLQNNEFSYVPQDFMDKDVFFYNFGWQDYGVGSLTNILDMVRVMQFAVEEGKVAVHCHAGRGRTGVLIACYLVFANRMDPGEVIHYVRHKRPMSVQTKGQTDCIYQFAQYLEPYRVVFSTHSEKAYDFTLSQFLVRQRNIMHGFESRTLKNIPKIIYVCCERLLELAYHSYHHKSSRSTLEDIRKSAPLAFDNHSSQSQPKAILKVSSSPSLSQHGFGINQSIQSFTALPFRLSTQSLHKRDKAMDGDGGSNDSGSLGRQSSNDLDLNSVPPGEKGEAVASATGETQYHPDIQKVVDNYKKKLNEDAMAYKELWEETSPLILSALMWDWLDHLKEPIIHPQDMGHMLEYMEDPETGLKKLDKGACGTIEFMFTFISKLGKMNDKTQDNLIQRTLSTLTHQNMVLEFDDVLAAESKKVVRRTSNDTGMMRGNVAERLMHFFSFLLHNYKLKQRRLEGENAKERDTERKMNGKMNGRTESRKGERMDNKESQGRSLSRKRTDSL